MGLGRTNNLYITAGMRIEKRETYAKERRVQFTKDTVLIVNKTRDYIQLETETVGEGESVRIHEGYCTDNSKTCDISFR